MLTLIEEEEGGGGEDEPPPPHPAASNATPAPIERPTASRRFLSPIGKARVEIDPQAIIGAKHLGNRKLLAPTIRESLCALFQALLAHYSDQRFDAGGATAVGPNDRRETKKGGMTSNDRRPKDPL